MAKSKFQALFDKHVPVIPVSDRIEHAAPSPSVTPDPRPIGRPPGKRSDPAWKQYSILLRRETQRKAANRLRDDDAAPDFSGLVQELLEAWLRNGKP